MKTVLHGLHGKTIGVVAASARPRRRRPPRAEADGPNYGFLANAVLTTDEAVTAKR